MAEKKARNVQSAKTNIEVDRVLSERIGSLVGRYGRTKGDVVAAGLDCLEGGVVQ